MGAKHNSEPFPFSPGCYLPVPRSWGKIARKVRKESNKIEGVKLRELPPEVWACCWYCFLHFGVKLQLRKNWTQRQTLEVREWMVITDIRNVCRAAQCTVAIEFDLFPSFQAAADANFSSPSLALALVSRPEYTTKHTLLLPTRSRKADRFALHPKKNPLRSRIQMNPFFI